MKKIVAITIASLLALGSTTMVFADTDDAAWIKKCTEDNKNEGQTPEVIAAYCTCMNNQMSSGETKSITAWEKTNKKESDACSKEAGWK